MNETGTAVNMNETGTAGNTLLLET